MSNKLPIRMMTDELYDKLKEDGSFTEVNSFTGKSETVQNIPQALNVTPDKTDITLAKVQSDFSELEQTVQENSKKYYRHNLSANFDTGQGYLSILFFIYSSKEQPYSASTLLEKSDLVSCNGWGALFRDGEDAEYQGAIALLLGQSNIYYYGVLGKENNQIVCLNGMESMPTIDDTVEEI